LIRLHNLFPLIALLLALMPAAPATGGDLARQRGGSIVQAIERIAQVPSLDLATRKNRHAGSIEEFFAIDDDSDQDGKSPALPIQSLAWFVLVAEPRPATDRDALLSHWPCAAPATGPPHV